MMTKTVSRFLQRCAQAALSLGALAATQAAFAVNDLPGGPGVNQLNLHTPVTRIGVEQHFLHNFMLVVCIAIFVAVFGVMFYSILKHRKSVGHIPAALAATSAKALRQILPWQMNTSRRTAAGSGREMPAAPSATSP